MVFNNLPQIKGFVTHGNLAFSKYVCSPRLPELVKPLLQKLHWNEFGVSSMNTTFLFRCLGTQFFSEGLTVVLILKKEIEVSFSKVTMGPTVSLKFRLMESGHFCTFAHIHIGVVATKQAGRCCNH